MELSLILLGVTAYIVVWLYKHHVSIDALKADIAALEAKYSKQ